MLVEKQKDKNQETREDIQKRWYVSQVGSWKVGNIWKFTRDRFTFLVLSSCTDRAFYPQHVWCLRRKKVQIQVWNTSMMKQMKEITGLRTEVTIRNNYRYRKQPSIIKYFLTMVSKYYIGIVNYWEVFQ